jgi:acetyl esterase/lipase
MDTRHLVDPEIADAIERLSVELGRFSSVPPMLDDRPTASAAWEDALVWPPAANRIGWQAYLGDVVHATPLPCAAAARANDLAGLPPAFVVVGSVEIFLDESIEYARRLVHAGVPTDLHVHAGAPHGFETMAPGAAVTRRAFRALEDWLGSKLGDSRAKR